MADNATPAAIVGKVDPSRVLELERALIQIPSSTFKEQAIADFLADYLERLGLEVDMMDVPHPFDASIVSRQPVARLAGSGGGPTLMLNGHMDPGVEMSGWSVDPYGAKFEDGWIWGMGAHDDKGGLVGAICGVAAIVESGIRLAGDVLVTPVIAHKLGGAGTRALLDHGVRADLCINMEHSNNTIANVCVGMVMVRIRVHAPELFFRYSAEAKAAYMNPIEQIAEVVRRIGPSLDPIPHGSWMRFESEPELPGFPTHTFDTCHKEHYYHPNHTGLSSREAELQLQFRTVPGQSVESVRADLTRLLDGIKTDHPAFDYELEIPAPGTERTWCQDPMLCPIDHPLVRALADGQRLASGGTPEIGGYGRLGNVGDGNIIAALGIPTVQYGPGDIRIYKEWPTPDERVRLDDLVIAARAVAYATARLCG
ncbi:MAG TPA: M20/M25/M40 family metallo-hydrolase [Geminicoccaceae bacterium]|nr:M20/M25/M40 family metallo-hydrolase [Geminicoccaceae bacterium]